MEKEKHRNNRGATETPQTSKMESFAAIFYGFVNALLVGLSATTLEIVQDAPSVAGKYCNIRREKLEKNGKRIPCNV